MNRRTLLSASAAVLAAPSILRAATPLKLRIGWANTPAQLPPIIFAHKQNLKNYGKSYTVELTYFRGSTPQITALAAGELDIAALAFSSFALAIQNAHMDDLRVIGDLYQDGVANYYSSQYVVRADSPIHDVSQLKGKVIAINGIGGAIDMAMLKRLRDAKLENGRDCTLIEVQFPAMPAMLDSGKVNLAGMVAPFSLEQIRAGKARALFSIKDAMGVTQTTLMAARTPFIAQHRAALIDFMQDMQAGTKWLLDPANRDASLNIVSSVTKQPVSAYSFWLFTHDDYYRSPQVRPNLKALADNIRVQKDLGFLRSEVDVPKHADLSLVEAAAGRPA